MADPGGIWEERGILPDLEKFFFFNLLEFLLHSIRSENNVVYPHPPPLLRKA